MLFSPDGSLLASTFNARDPNDPTSDVTIWAVEDFTRIATFYVDLGFTDRIIFSPDGSQLAALFSYQIFNVGTECPTQQIGREDLNWVPHLNGTLISREHRNSHGDSLVGRYIDRPDTFPVLLIPSHVNVRAFAVGSSIFALGTRDGQVLIGRAPTSSIH